MLSYIERIADLLDIEPSGVVLYAIVIVLFAAIAIFAWFLYWTWMFQFFGGR